LFTKNTSIDISGKLHRGVVELYRAVDKAASQLEIPYLIVGAMARDLVMVHGFGSAIERGTRDIDFGIQVVSWSHFDTLRRQLINRGFSRSKEPQRLISPEEWDLDIRYIDLVPFGALSDTDDRIVWPPTGEIKMSVLGFAEALDNAIHVRVDGRPELILPVVSPPGMALLKLVAWGDRDVASRAKDAHDILYLMGTYLKIDAMVNEAYETGVMDSFDHEFDLAGAYLLSRHAKHIAAPVTAHHIAEILQNETLSDALLLDMSRGRDADLVAAQLNAFRLGFCSL
jgi:predicted nucleotidyltransferase